MTAGFGNAPLIRNEGFNAGDPTDDKTGGRFSLAYAAFLKTLGITLSGGSTKNLTTEGNLIAGTAGKGLQIKSGSNARIGQLTLVAGTVTVANTSVTALTRIFLSKITNGGTAGNLTVTRSNGVSFTVTSSSNTDTSTFDYMLVESVA